MKISRSVSSNIQSKATIQKDFSETILFGMLTIKNRLLSIQRSGIYASLSPEKVHFLHKETLQFLLLNQSKLSKIELFDLYELQFFLCLTIGNDVQAKAMLDRILDHFGKVNSQRLKILQSLYFEAIGEIQLAKDVIETKKLEDETLLDRRLVGLSRYDDKNNLENYLKGLVKYLDMKPLDVQAWSELSEQYLKIGNYDKAIFCLKEILLIQPFAYNVFYKVGLFNYYQCLQTSQESNTNSFSTQNEIFENLQQARNNLLRGIELCDDFLKAWCALYYLTLPGNKLNIAIEKISHKEPTVSKYLSKNSALNELALTRLTEMKAQTQDDFLIKEIETLVNSIK